jgi:hypothetical protein
MNENEFDHDADLDISQQIDNPSVNKPTQEENSESTLAGHETRQLRKVRLVFLCILVLMAAGMAYAITTITRNDEKDAFEAKFVDHATKVIDSFHSSAHLKARGNGVAKYCGNVLCEFQERDVAICDTSGLRP